MNKYGLRLSDVTRPQFNRWISELSAANTSFRCGLCGNASTITRIRSSDPNEGKVRVLEFTTACPCDPNAETTVTMTKQK